MTKKLFLFFAFCSTLIVNAQYTTVINSNRPGFSESPYSVGSGVYQFESSLFFRKANATPTFSNPQALGLNLLFRTSFISEKLELNVNTTLQHDKIAFKNIFESSYNKTGLSQLTLGAKYLVYTPKYDNKKDEIRSWKARHSFDYKRWIPHVGVYAGINFGSILSDFHEKGGVSPKVGVLLQNEFSDKLRMVTNFYYDYIGTDFSEFSYVLTGTYNFNDYWSGFAEIQGIFEKYETKSNIGAGAAYLFSENLQFNAAVRASFQQNEIGFYTGLGVSYRLDRHQDEFVEIDEFGNKIEEQEEVKYNENKGFFGRLFGKVKNVFKKKDKQTITVNDGEKEEEITVEKPRRERQKSLIDVIEKEDKKLKKKATKAEKRAAKKAKKKAEKDAKKKEKERLKLEKKLQKDAEKETKQKEKDRLKLEKEIKKLEEDLKKEEDEEQKKDN
ncbi:transporter [Tenacibaculum sp. S7007]|uniref:Transporter n=1 Tax=Tenacibaculum pelagium TaxID=2759527 RepID=A0A839ANE9_9FLAO|nr:transporter [Tenacibaculum pelagium]MBA6156632.1 transporter [Tenacibaculum pelagium]